MVVAVSRHHRGRMAICFCTSLIRLPWSSCQREKHRNVCRRARPPKLQRVAFCVHRVAGTGCNPLGTMETVLHRLGTPTQHHSARPARTAISLI